MFKNYLTIALRNIARHKGYSLINIVGLAIGFACAIVIFCYVSHELSYDTFHKDADRIYRVVTRVTMENKVNDWALIMGPIGPALLNDFPEITKMVRLHKFMDSTLVVNNEKNLKFYEENVIFAEDSFFDLFAFELKRGNPEKVLSNPGAVVITEDMAKKYFGDEDPLGKSLICREVECRVTGIAKTPPTNSHFNFDFLVSFATLDKDYVAQWRIVRVHTYIQIAEGVTPGDLEQKFQPFMDKYVGSDLAEMGIKKWELFLQPITDIHLHSHLRLEIEPNGDITNIYIFLTIAFFVLIIASINFMILTTARSANRAREVGVRKSFGAERTNLIRQFIGESILMSLIGLLVAFIIVKLFFIVFNDITGREVGLNLKDNWYFLFAFMAMALIVGIIGGAYPAFFLSAFKPVRVLKGDLKSGKRSLLLRNILVVLQFVISIAIISCMSIVYRQLEFIKQRDLGFKKENLLVVDLRRAPYQEQDRVRYDALKAEILKIPGVESFSAALTYPGHPIDENVVFPEGWSGSGSFSLANLPVDYDFIDTMGMKLVDGRRFSKEFPSDIDGVIINETAARDLGWKDPIGKRLRHIFGRGERIWTQTVVGVVQDFHFASLHNKIQAIKLSLNWRLRRVLIRLDPGNIPRTIDAITRVWDQFYPAYPIDYFFFEDSLDNLYVIEQRIGKAFIYFTLLSMFIACLGLYGLASFSTEQRTREIGIRKAHGATVVNIASLILKDIIKLVVIATLIAAPIAYIAMNSWLKNYAYQIDIGFFTFILSGFIALVIAVATVGYQAVKAARIDPVKTLKYE